MGNRIEYLDHTGDTGIRLHVDSLQELFIMAAKAMFEVMCYRTAQRNDLNFEVKVEGNDLEELMVNWLSELNFLFQTEQFVLSEVPSISIEKNALHAQVTGEKFDAQRHEIHTEIKAVTYHKIYVRPEQNGWGAQIIFDI